MREQMKDAKTLQEIQAEEINRLRKWKILGDHQVMNLRKEYQKLVQKIDDLRFLVASWGPKS